MERADHCAGGGVRQTRDPLARTGMRRGRFGIRTIYAVPTEKVMTLE